MRIDTVDLVKSKCVWYPTQEVMKCVCVYIVGDVWGLSLSPIHMPAIRL